MHPSFASRSRSHPPGFRGMRSPGPSLLLPGFAVAATALSISLFPAPALAQSVTLDEGTFRITVDGREAGTETFTIRRSGAGDAAQVIATAEIQMQVPEGRTDIRPALQASGSDMAVSAYQVKISGATQEEVYVTLGERRFLTTVRSERGEREREFRATPGTLLLDPGVAHQYYFLAGRAGTAGGTFPVISPREGRQFELRVTVVGTESVTIGGSPVQARHLRLEGEGGTRELWVNGDGRVLRLEHPDAGYVAVREQAP
jgi:hypothetical protein